MISNADVKMDLKPLSIIVRKSVNASNLSLTPFTKEKLALPTLLDKLLEIS